MSGFYITVKNSEGTDGTHTWHKYLLDHDVAYGVKPGTITELKHALGTLFSASYEWNDENEEKMRQWYDVADALDEESYFPVHFGPTPDGLTFLVERLTPPDPDKVIDAIDNLVSDEDEGVLGTIKAQIAMYKIAKGDRD